MTRKSQRLRLRFDRQASVLGSMLSFARQGVRVLPVYGIVDGRCGCGESDCEGPGKHPIGSLVGNGANGATTDRKTIRRWHRRHPGMNYAVATDGLAVIDCDSAEALRAFRRDYSPPPTLTVKTARGFHFYFRGEMPARNGARTNLDVKSGAGLYVVGPGSTHRSGKPYALWEDVPIAGLSEAVRSITETPQGDPDRSGDGTIPTGMRNTVMTQIAGYLHSRHVPQRALLDALKSLNRTIAEEPLSPRELSKIARSVSRYPVKALPGIIPFADIADEKLEWLWYPFISLRTLGLIDGSPGDGKSQFTAWLCARISRGDTLPNGDAMEPANCFLCNFEDLPGAVIKKRLEANGADLNRVFIQNRSFRLTPDMVEWLEGEIAKHQARLVILDPIQSVITKDTDTNSNVDVREFMDRLREVAERQGCTIICVRHFGKGSHDRAMMKGIGSTDFYGIARNQLGLARRRDQVRGFVVSQLKTNFDEGDAMLFTMGDADGRKGQQPKIAFDRFEKIDADEFFASGPAKRGPEQDEREVAKTFLREALADGPKPATTLKSQAEARAISASTLNRAREDLDVITAKQGKIWFWSLPVE